MRNQTDGGKEVDPTSNSPEFQISSYSFSQQYNVVFLLPTVRIILDNFHIKSSFPGFVSVPIRFLISAIGTSI
jgi:hypothetical protein